MSVVKARVQQEARRAALQLSAAPAGERTAADPNRSRGATRGLNNTGPGLLWGSLGSGRCEQRGRRGGKPEPVEFAAV